MAPESDHQVDGRGYATEAGGLALEVGFGEYGLQSVVGRAQADNAASLAVLRKLGMSPQQEFREGGCRWLQFVVTGERWAARRGRPE